jgi:Family of unknown function (DUF5908)
MPVEISEIIIKASVENRAKIAQNETAVNITNTDFELLLKQIQKKLKAKNER